MKTASAIATLALLSLPATGTTPVEGRDASRGLDGGVPAELNAYIQSVSARLAIKDRQTDVFGRYQDPNQAVIFPDVVKAIEVDSVIPTKKQFLVGSRKFSVGSVLPIRLASGGKTVKAELMDVTAETITFRNQDSGETAIRKIAPQHGPVDRIIRPDHPTNFIADSRLSK